MHKQMMELLVSRQVKLVWNRLELNNLVMVNRLEQERLVPGREELVLNRMVQVPSKPVLVRDKKKLVENTLDLGLDMLVSVLNKLVPGMLVAGTAEQVSNSSEQNMLGLFVNTQVQV